MMLQGWEVKSLREGKAQIINSYIRFLGDELFLVGAHIQPPDHISAQTDYDEGRSRKLLMQRKEINKIKGSLQTKGLACVPLRLKWKKQFVKCDIALGRGKKLHDKRAAIKERDIQRSLRKKEDY